MILASLIAVAIASVALHLHIFILPGDETESIKDLELIRALDIINEEELLLI